MSWQLPGNWSIIPEKCRPFLERITEDYSAALWIGKYTGVFMLGYITRVMLGYYHVGGLK